MGQQKGFSRRIFYTVRLRFFFPRFVWQITVSALVKHCSFHFKIEITKKKIKYYKSPFFLHFNISPEKLPFAIYTAQLHF